MSIFQLSYREWGTWDNPSVLMLHGFLGCKEDWSYTAEALADTYRAIAVDLPGHGASVEGIPESAYTMRGCASAVIELLDQLGITQCDLVGYSMGGRLALFLACHLPKRWRSVVLESASPGLATEKERTERRAHDYALAEKLLSVGVDRFLDDWYAQPLFAGLGTSEKFPELMSRRRRNSAEGLARSLKLMGTGAQPSLWAELPRVALPMLFLAGERDAKFTRVANESAAACPSSRAVIIQGAGHTLHFEAPAQYIGEVQRHLQSRK